MTIYRRSLLRRGSGRQQEIRLLELLPGSTDDAIRCNVVYKDLDLITSSRITYEALSYCWGEETIKKSIIVDGTSHLWVTTNLHSALYHIRQTEDSRLLW